ncbi:MAG: long-chain-fatty-acid--CoA ligase [Acidobacteria bacterium]|nr:MAG: long-chain-fatty-acid--CoA ligase [Acidobacteriota bacterium]
MKGLMQDHPLLISSIIRFARRNHQRVEIVSAMGDGRRHRTTYGRAYRRIAQLAHALTALGVAPGERIATLAWNDYRHFEIYYAVSGIGAVCHTLNLRLFPEQLAYIINHADDRMIFVDPMFVPLLEQLGDAIPGVRHVVVLCDEDELPSASLPDLRSYESLIAGHDEEYDWPLFDENTASSLCYTSGTTGNPKGVLYSHRSTVLHAYAAALPDGISLSRRDAVLPVVPMFHVNAWGIPYMAPMVGAKLVMPGQKMADGEALQALIEDEGVTVALGVPTIWLALLQYLERSGKGLGRLERTMVGGAACPPAMIKTFLERYGVYTRHGWGMTEMSPVGTVNTPRPDWAEMEPEERERLMAKQGHGLFGVEMRITGDDGEELPWDGESRGQLEVRGPFVCAGYYRLEESPSHKPDGWFMTGDVATIDADGYMQIVDRTKDVIKSGGEWVSSIDLENLAVAHPAVAEAAVIGVAHPKWSERPLLIVVKQPGAELSRDEMLAFFDGKVASWWIPDDVVFVEELPHTATGKVQKTALREQFRDYVLPTA